MSQKWVLELGFILLFLVIIVVVIPIAYDVHGHIPASTQFEQFNKQKLDMKATLPDIHVISYASGRFKNFIPQKTKQLKRLFGDIPFSLKIYEFKDVDPQFVKTHQDTFNCKDGGGLWLWKPWLVNHHLNHIAKDGDIVVYMDIGREISKLNISKLLQQVNQSDSGMLAFSEIEREKTLALKCKGSHIRAAGIPLDYVNDKQNIIACFLMLKVQANVKHVMAEWLRICCIPGMLMYDQHLEGPNPTIFRPSEFRHDQSILAPMMWWHKAVIVQCDIPYSHNENMWSIYRIKRWCKDMTGSWSASYNKLIHNDYCYNSSSTHSTKHGTSSYDKTATNESNNSQV